MPIRRPLEIMALKASGPNAVGRRGTRKDDRLGSKIAFQTNDPPARFQRKNGEAGDGFTLNHAQRRKLQRLTNRIDRKILAGDRKFFERFPHRSYRVRLASQLELAACRVVDPTWPGVPAGCSAYVAVKQIAPGIRARVFFVERAGKDTDLSEEDARKVLAEHRHPQLAEIETALGSIAKNKGGRA
jgi:hypothetical protein